MIPNYVRNNSLRRDVTTVNINCSILVYLQLVAGNRPYIYSRFGSTPSCFDWQTTRSPFRTAVTVVDKLN